MAEASPATPDRRSDDTEGLPNDVRVGRRILHAESAARGGDWCEAFTVSASLIALSIGDVAGHGVESHHTMAVLRGSNGHAAHAGLDPAATLALANRVLFGVRADVCATAIFALLEGEEQLRAAARFAYGQRAATPAMIIEQHIGIGQPHFDDAAILTVWLPNLA